MSLALHADDGFALAMIAILTMSIGTVFLLLLSIVRHGHKRNREVEDLLDEVEREDRQTQPAHKPPQADKRQPWERDPDWWNRQ